MRVDTLRKLLRYDDITGKLFWRPRPTSMFSGGKYGAARDAKLWNTRYAGKEGFTAYDSHGYKHGTISGRNYRAHRIVWALVHGEWPTSEIDHVNGVRDDNRIENLRLVTASENRRNSARSSRNTSGVTGVHWNRQRRKWVARIKVSGKTLWIGSFARFQDATAARKSAEIQFEFHENHGRAA